MSLEKGPHRRRANLRSEIDESIKARVQTPRELEVQAGQGELAQTPGRYEQDEKGGERLPRESQERIRHSQCDPRTSSQRARRHTGMARGRTGEAGSKSAHCKDCGSGWREETAGNPD